MVTKNRTKIRLLVVMSICLSSAAFGKSYPEVEPNDDYMNAQFIESNDTIQGSIGAIYDSKQDSVDWFKIVVDAPARFHQIYENKTRVTVGIDICSIDREGNLVGRKLLNNNTFDTDIQTLFTTLYPGVYYIKIKRNVAYTYTFCFLLFPCRKNILFEDEEPNNSIETAIPIVADTFFEGNVGFLLPDEGMVDQGDYYTFTVPEKSFFEIIRDTALTLINNSPGFDLYRYGASSKIITGGIETTSVNKISLSASVYYVKIFSEFENDYRIKYRLFPDTTIVNRVQFDEDCIFYSSMNMLVDSFMEDTFTNRSGNVGYGNDRNQFAASAASFSNAWLEGNFRKDSIGILNQYGICFWLKNVNYAWCYVLTIGDNNNMPGAFNFTIGMEKEIEIFTVGANSTYSPNTLPVDSCNIWKSKWTHHAIMRDSTGKGTLIVNGNSRFNLNIGPITSTNKFFIGDRYQKNRPFYGAMDELYIIDRPFTDDELKKLAEVSETGVRKPREVYFTFVKKDELPHAYNLLGKRIAATGAVGNGIYIERYFNRQKNTTLLLMK